MQPPACSAGRSSSYSYKLEVRRTEEHGNADALSRFPLNTTGNQHEMTAAEVYHAEFLESTVTAAAVRDETRKDPLLSRVVDRLKSGWQLQDPNTELSTFYKKRLELSLEARIILGGRRVVVPRSLRDQVLFQLHEEHMGIVRMKGLARSYVWWPGLDEQLEMLAKDCPACQVIRNVPPPSTDLIWPSPPDPWHRIHIDFAGPVNRQMILVLVDASTKWPEVIPVSSTTSASTIEELRSIFARFGLPVELVSDNGPQFTSSEFQEFMEGNGILHRMGAPFHPSTNGLAERMVQSVKQALNKIEKEPGSLKSKISRFLFSYRNTPHSTTGKSPATLMFGRLLRNRMDLLRPATITPPQLKPIVAKFQPGQPVLAIDYRPGRKW